MIYKLVNKVKRTLVKEENNAIRQWLANLKPCPITKGNILITALRNKTWIEWAVYSACVLRQKGYKPILLFNQSEVVKDYGENSFFWNKTMEIPDIDFVNLKDFAPDQKFLDQFKSKIPLFIYDAIAYDYHLERENIINEKEKYQTDIDHLITYSSIGATALEQLFSEKEIATFICYSGLISFSPTLLNTAKKHEVKTVCIEGWAWKKGHLIYNFNDPALEYNIKGWIAHYGWGADQKKTIEEYIGFQEGKLKEKKNWLEGFHNVQLAPVDADLNSTLGAFVTKYPKSFLLAPNVIGDSSTLNRETIFEGQQSWIKEVIEFFKKNPQLSLIIRAHPAEVWVDSKVKVKLGEYAEKLANGIENILVISGNEKVNTFTLMPYVKTGLIWLSSVGVDLVVRNINVICAASPKYGGLDMVEEPKSKEEYFERVLFYADQNEGTTADQKLIAKKYLYTVFKGFSFQAQGVEFNAATLRLNNMPEQKEHDRFFEIITSEIPAPDELPQKS